MTLNRFPVRQSEPDDLDVSSVQQYLAAGQRWSAAYRLRDLLNVFGVLYTVTSCGASCGGFLADIQGLTDRGLLTSCEQQTLADVFDQCDRIVKRQWPSVDLREQALVVQTIMRSVDAREEAARSLLDFLVTVYAPRKDLVAVNSHRTAINSLEAFTKKQLRIGDLTNGLLAEWYRYLLTDHTESTAQTHVAYVVAMWRAAYDWQFVITLPDSSSIVPSVPGAQEQTRVDRTCRECGVSIADRHLLTIFCSQECKHRDAWRRKKSKMPKEEMFCKRCGVSLPSGSRRDRMYCSRACRDGMPVDQETCAKRKCKECGTSIADRHLLTIYCSPRCLMRNRRGRDQKPKSDKKPKPDRFCKRCNALIPGRTRVTKIYCSRRCCNADYRAMLKTKEDRFCKRCGELLPRGSRRDRLYCSEICRNRDVRARDSESCNPESEVNHAQ